MAETTTPTVDMAAIQAEISNLPKGDLVEQLTKFRVRQKTQQKKQQDKGSQKTYQLRQREKFKAMKERALNTPATMVDPETNAPYANLWEQINAVAEIQAERAVEESAAVPGEDETEATAS